MEKTRELKKIERYAKEIHGEEAVYIPVGEALKGLSGFRCYELGVFSCTLGSFGYEVVSSRSKTE